MALDEKSIVIDELGTELQVFAKEGGSKNEKLAKALKELQLQTEDQLN